jgi:hypothetical protein
MLIRDGCEREFLFPVNERREPFRRSATASLFRPFSHQQRTPIESDCAIVTQFHASSLNDLLQKIEHQW